MKSHQVGFFLLLSIFITACASTSKLYFKETLPDKPHAVLKFELGEKVGLFLDVRVAKVMPHSINGLPVNSWEQQWKLHAYGEFLIPPGDTIVILSYQDRGAEAYGYVRFYAQRGEVYKVTHNKNEATVGFSVTNQDHQLVTSTQFDRKKYIYTGQELYMASALFEAAADGNIEEVQSLLASGAEPNWSGPRGFTPLIIAASRGHKEIVMAMIEAGAGVNASATWTALTFAADRGYEAILKILLDSGAYIDFRMPGEYNALLAAVERGNVGVVKMLLLNGVYTNTRDRNGKTALDLAKDAGNREMVDMLEEAGVKF